MAARKLLILIIIAVAVWQFKAGFFSNFFDNFADRQTKEESQSVFPGYEKEQLLEILEVQNDLIEEIKNARESGDKNSIRESYEEILSVDQNYRETFEKYKDQLSISDNNEISKKHYKIMKRLPSFSSLMK